MSEYKEVKSEIYKFEKVGDTIEGKYVAIKDSGLHKNSVYHLETGKGNEIIFGTVILNEKMAHVPIGSQVRITFEGVEPTKTGQELKLFKVEYK